MAIQLSDEMIIMTPEIVLRRTLQFHCKGSFNTLFKDEHIVLMLKREVCNFLNVQTYLPFASPITNATEFAILKL
jgi:hypothetical protein